MKKIFYDLETTGVDPKLHGVHEIAMMLEIDGVLLAEKVFKVRPHERAIYDPAAMRTCKTTPEELKKYPPMRGVFMEIIEFLSRFIDKFEQKDKAFLVGFNNRSFDDIFFRAFFELCGDPFFGSWFWPNTLDVMVLASQYLLERRAEMPSFKLVRVAKELGIEVDSSGLHSAAYDSYLTREVYQIVTGIEMEL